MLPVLMFIPLIAGAQRSYTGSSSGSSIGSILGTISNIFNILIPMLITLGVIYFIWGVITYIIGKDEEAKEKGRTIMIYGIIGLFAIIAMWGLVRVLTNTFLGGDAGSITNDQLPCIGGGCI